MSPSALDGLRVLDLTRLLPGAYCTMLLADLGADVVKVEEPGTGDPTRAVPPYTASGESGAHLALNRGKRSIALDLRTDVARQALLDLVETADVLVESFRPGVMSRLGVGYEVLAEVNPRLVYVALSGYGQEGPYAHRAGHDINYLSVTGSLSFTGHPATGPLAPGLQMADLGGGMLATVAVLAALRSRDVTGAGQLCDVGLADAAMSMLALAAGVFGAEGVPPGLGRWWLAGGLACYGTYRCADGGYVAVGALEPRFFVELCERLGCPELAVWQYDPARQDVLRERLAAVFEARPRDEWVALLAGHDTCVTPVLDVGEAMVDRHNRARGLVEDVELPDGTAFPRLGVVPRLCATPGRPGGHPSALGADTVDLMTEVGWSPEDVRRLIGDDPA